MAYDEPPIEHVRVADLRLDLQNSRFPVSSVNAAAAMNLLFEEHDVLEVAKLILRSGYFDDEFPLVFQEDGANVILEGNRRVSALKALWDPTLVPACEQQLRQMLKHHATEAISLPESIRVMVVSLRSRARRPDPHEGQTSNNFRNATLGGSSHFTSAAPKTLSGPGPATLMSPSIPNRAHTARRSSANP